MIKDNTLISDLELEVIPTPFVQIPLDVMEDRLLGAVDVEQHAQEWPSLAFPCSQRGADAAAHRSRGPPAGARLPSGAREECPHRLDAEERWRGCGGAPTPAQGRRSRC